LAEVSIIVTAYNIESYITQCLDSVAAQTLTDLEVLVVDDGSTDATAQKIREFCARDPRFAPVLLPENSPGGVATAANAGLDLATAPWVGFVDGDDYIEPRMFERLVDAAEAGDADLVMCDYSEVLEGTSERRSPADAHRWAEMTGSRYLLDVDTRKQVLRFIAVPWRKLYRRRLLEDNEIRFPVSAGFYEDNPFHWFSVLSAHVLVMVPEVLCYHRVGRAGQTMAAADARLFQIFAHHDTIHTWLAGRRMLDVYETTLLGWVISQLEWIARRTPPQLRRQLFDTLVPIFAEYSPASVVTALSDGNKGVTAQRMATAITKRDYAAFAGTFAGRPGSKSPVLKAAFHLRHSGARHTARLAGRYVRRVLDNQGVTQAVARAVRVTRDPGAQDVMFGLMVVQHRLLAMEQRLNEMDGRLAEIEQGVVELVDAPAVSTGAATERASGERWYPQSELDRNDSRGRG
jgi:glycosyltransferase involved in cell wall biosynthesis